MDANERNGGMRMNLKKVGVQYTVFEKLEHFYDGNNSVYIISFDKEEDANKYVKEYPHHNYYVSMEKIYEVIK